MDGGGVNKWKSEGTHTRILVTIASRRRPSIPRVLTKLEMHVAFVSKTSFDLLVVNEVFHF